jgi:hypothetical protein
MRRCIPRVGGGRALFLPFWSGVLANRQRNLIPAFPFCHVTLRRWKPRHGYPDTSATLGEHLKKRRLDRGLRQRDVAEFLGVSKQTY